MNRVEPGSRNQNINFSNQHPRQHPQASRNLHTHVPVGQRCTGEELNARTQAGSQSHLNNRATHVPVGTRLDNTPLRTRPGVNSASRKPPSRTPSRLRNPIPVPQQPIRAASSRPTPPVSRNSAASPVYVGRRNKGGFTGFVNGLGKVPFLGTIVGIIRIAVNCLKLTVSNSPITHYYAKQELKRGALELIPFIGGAILAYKDRH